ncbi:twin-arginine translocation signal domain-containing protein [Nonomuraea sp. LPB2021202275-12-8]|uniref:twin-arginine translocation signal domain-containing protein n=1 Tax=Nonomuraea sp. LPB2021202275-12-8 TaxID=3120159 RepID=UPI00300D475B
MSPHTVRPSTVAPSDQVVRRPSAEPTRRRFLAGAAAVAGVAVASLWPSDRAHAAAGWQAHDFPDSSSSPSVNEAVVGIHASGPADAWAVGLVGAAPVLGRWDGSKWTKVAAPAVGGSISGAATGDIWAGDGSKAMHWNGSAWTEVAVPAAPRNWFYNGNGHVDTGSPGTAWLLSGLSYVYGPTSDHREQVSCWDGREWVVTPSPGTDGHDRVRGLSATGTTAWVVGGTVSSYVSSWSGTVWTRHDLPTGDAGFKVWSYAVAAVAQDQVWVAGDLVKDDMSPVESYLAHWDSKTWRRVPIPTGGRVARLYDLGGSVLLQTQSHHGVGRDALFRGSGGAWQELPPLLSAGDGRVFAGVPGGGVWAGGSRGYVTPTTARYTG